MIRGVHTMFYTSGPGAPRVFLCGLMTPFEMPGTIRVPLHRRLCDEAPREER